nr:MAG TPA: hypothetical protein [Bacteriophage sp.]
MGNIFNIDTSCFSTIMNFFHDFYRARKLKI